MDLLPFLREPLTTVVLFAFLFALPRVFPSFFPSRDRSPIFPYFSCSIFFFQNRARANLLARDTSSLRKNAFLKKGSPFPQRSGLDVVPFSLRGFICFKRFFYFKNCKAKVLLREKSSFLDDRKPNEIPPPPVKIVGRFFPFEDPLPDPLSFSSELPPLHIGLSLFFFHRGPIIPSCFFAF